MGVFGWSWGGLGGFLERSWAILGRLREFSGLLEAVLEWSWAVLGRSWAECFDHLIFDPFGDRFSKRVSEVMHFGSQNGDQIDPETRSKLNTKKASSWKRLGVAWVVFDGHPGDNFLEFPWLFV